MRPHSGATHLNTFKKGVSFSLWYCVTTKPKKGALSFHDRWQTLNNLLYFWSAGYTAVFCDSLSEQSAISIEKQYYLLTLGISYNTLETVNDSTGEINTVQ